MKKKLAAWEWIGFGVVCFLGTVLHFAYDWSGENAIIAAFSAVNEFFFAAALSQLVSRSVMRKGKWDRPVWQIAGVVIFMSLAALFVLFTYAPPQIPLFADPVTGRYGR